MQIAPLSRTFNIYIPRPHAETYDFLFQPENLPQWAGGLGQGVEKIEDGWIVHTPAGTVKRFLPREVTMVCSITPSIRPLAVKCMYRCV